MRVGLFYASFALEESCKRINGAAVRVRVRGEMGNLPGDSRDRKSSRLNSSHITRYRMPSSA